MARLLEIVIPSNDPSVLAEGALEPMLSLTNYVADVALDKTLEVWMITGLLAHRDTVEVFYSIQEKLHV